MVEQAAKPLARPVRVNSLARNFNFDFSLELQMQILTLIVIETFTVLQTLTRW